MGFNLGSFAAGMAGGLKTGSDFRAAQLKAEKDQLEVDAAKRKAAYESEVKDVMAQFSDKYKPTSEVELLDANGKSMGLQTFKGSLFDAKAHAQKNGLTVVEGTGREIKMDYDSFEAFREQSAALTALKIKHGQIDQDTLDKAFARDRMVQQEGVARAFKLAMTNPEAAIKEFNSTGGMKLPEGASFRMGSINGMPNIEVIGPDGNKIVDQFTIAMGSVSQEKLATMMHSSAESASRNATSLGVANIGYAGQIDSARISANSKASALQAELKKNGSEALNKLVQNTISNEIGKDAAATAEGAARQQWYLKAGALASQYEQQNPGLTTQQAWQLGMARATREHGPIPGSSQ